MNIDIANPKITTTSVNSGATSGTKTVPEDSPKFSEELNALSKKEESKEVEKNETEEKSEKIEETKQEENVKEPETEEKVIPEEDSKIEIETDKKTEYDKDNKPEKKLIENKNNPEINNVLNGLKDTVDEINKVKYPNQQNHPDEKPLDSIKIPNELNPQNKLDHPDEKPLDSIKIPNELNPQNKLDHSDEKPVDIVKPPALNTDKNKNDEDNTLINNDMNIQDPKEPVMPQMNSGMNFDTNGQPFREFMNNQQSELNLSQKDLEEESAILSTMSENLAIASKNIIMSQKAAKETEKAAPVQPEENTEFMQDRVQPKVKTVSNEQGVKKVDAKTNVTVETVVKYDNIIMDKGDVEFFTKLVENGSVDMNTAVHQAGKSAQVSKTLADMLAKSMQDNQPVRIDFDNDISVIIKVSRQGKISADFLPSSQVAEAYLKENLPLLKQRFDENNIEYDELNQRKQRQDEKENRKKGRKDE